MQDGSSTAPRLILTTDLSAWNGTSSDPLYFQLNPKPKEEVLLHVVLDTNFRWPPSSSLQVYFPTAEDLPIDEDTLSCLRSGWHTLQAFVTTAKDNTLLPSAYVEAEFCLDHCENRTWVTGQPGVCWVNPPSTVTTGSAYQIPFIVRHCVISDKSPHGCSVSVYQDGVSVGSYSDSSQPISLTAPTTASDIVLQIYIVRPNGEELKRYNYGQCTINVVPQL